METIENKIRIIVANYKEQEKNITKLLSLINDLTYLHSGESRSIFYYFTDYSKFTENPDSYDSEYKKYLKDLDTYAASVVKDPLKRIIRVNVDIVKNIVKFLFFIEHIITKHREDEDLTKPLFRFRNAETYIEFILKNISQKKLPIELSEDLQTEIDTVNKNMVATNEEIQNIKENIKDSILKKEKDNIEKKYVDEEQKIRSSGPPKMTTLSDGRQMYAGKKLKQFRRNTTRRNTTRRNTTRRKNN
jgi:hypothetical protein